jgi:hypothetical protein
MTYVNLTGKNIGECLTGFAINYPFTIFNSGNSDVFYQFEIEDDANNFFSLSDSSLILNNGQSGNVRILYCPPETSPAANNTCDVVISSESIEDGSVDPSGNITIEITGSKIVNTTGGHIRNFVALKNYDSSKGINYDFRWFPPTGTGNLKNYFFTGYRLEIATNTNFSSLVHVEDLNITENTNNKPRFSTFYGYEENDLIIKNISQFNYPTAGPIQLDTNYYARLYTNSCGNSGISIYASGIDSLNDTVSNEVLVGYSGATIPNIKFNKKTLEVIVPQSAKYENFDLFKNIINYNNGSDDLSFYSGINVYLSEGSRFFSSASDKYAINLLGIFKNFTGDNTDGTVVNLYVPQNVFIFGNQGKGGDISNILPSAAVNSFDLAGIFKASDYTKSSNGLTDSQPGGNVFDLSLQTDKDGLKSNLVYNIYIQKNTSIVSGGGGNKAGFASVGNNVQGQPIIGTGSDFIERKVVFPIAGANNTRNTYFLLKDPRGLTLDNLAKLISPPPEYGEDAVDNIVLYDFPTRSYITNSVSNIKVYNPNDEGNQRFTVQTNNSQNKVLYQNGSLVLNKYTETMFVKLNNNAASSCGKLINKLSGSTVKLNFYNDNISTDYVFRLNNADLNTGPVSWSGKNSGGTTIITLGTSVVTPEVVADFRSLGYKSLKLQSGDSLKGVFSSNIFAADFDLFIVGAVEGSTENVFPSNNSSFFNWYANGATGYNAIINIILESFRTTVYKSFSKEPNIFTFFFPLLYNETLSAATATNFYNARNETTAKALQVSKQLNSSIVGGGYYPFILNIQREGQYYSIYINGNLVSSYSLPVLQSYLTQLNNTCFDLSNIPLTGASNVNNLYFDAIFYNRVLFNTERVQMFNSLSKTYLKLFSGFTDSSLLLNSRIQLPNNFNIAGRI